jgi:uncharacterized membrane protein
VSIKLSPDQTVLAASHKLALALVSGIVVGVLVGFAGSWKLAPLIAWDIAAIVYMAITWRRVLKFDADLTKKHALREDPSRVMADIVLLVASVISLAAVGLVLVNSGQTGGPARIAQPLLSVASVIVSWLMIHTVYALRYAELYYRAPQGGVEFGDTHEPIYADFAYLAFTLGMTYQVSDTTLGARKFRTTALKHALLSYLFGAVIIATIINLIAGLGN